MSTNTMTETGANHAGYRVVAFMPHQGVLTLSADHISCGCCRGPAEDRCCCYGHMDMTRGIRPKVCSRHAHLFEAHRQVAPLCDCEAPNEDQSRHIAHVSCDCPIHSELVNVPR